MMVTERKANLPMEIGLALYNHENTIVVSGVDSKAANVTRVYVAVLIQKHLDAEQRLQALVREALEEAQWRDSPYMVKPREWMIKAQCLLLSSDKQP